jgi:hypothetical protein
MYCTANTCVHTRSEAEESIEEHTLHLCIVVDGPYVQDDACVFGNAVAHVLIVSYHGVWSAENGCGHPAHGLFDTGLNLWEIIVYRR